MPEDLGERTEEATPRRLHEAREEGNVARSADMAGSLLLLGVTIMLWAGLMPTLGGLKSYLEQALGPATIEEMVLPGDAAEASALALHAAARVAMPLLLVAWIVAFVSYFWQIGWLFTPKSIQPNINKLNPISGFKRIFGVRGLVKAGLDGSKVAVVLAVVAISIAAMMDEIILLPYLSMMAAAGKVGWLMFDLALRVLAVLLILGILDFIWQKWKYKRDLRMTKTEIREEFKQTEGDPEMKKRRMRMQQQIAMQRVSAAVPKADVVVTNPEHISIAIQYDEKTMGAPRVVAKGADFLAMRIRHIAMQHGIPIVERKPLARSLYRSVNVGQEIPPDFYQAVAEILAYVYRLSGKAAANRQEAAASRQ